MNEDSGQWPRDEINPLPSRSGIFGEAPGKLCHCCGWAGHHARPALIAVYRPDRKSLAQEMWGCEQTWLPNPASTSSPKSIGRRWTTQSTRPAGNCPSFDFKGTGSTISWAGEHAVEIKSNSEERAKAALDVFKSKLVKRVSLKILTCPRRRRCPAGVPPADHAEGRHQPGERQEDRQDDPRGVPKGVKAQIQGDELRVSSKKKDDLQAVIAMLKNSDLDVALQFVNFR